MATLKNSDTNTQCAQILAHLQAGNSITGIDALNMFGCFRLPSRIWDLKQKGHEIDKATVELNNGKRVASYRLAVQNG